VIDTSWPIHWRSVAIVSSNVRGTHDEGVLQSVSAQQRLAPGEAVSGVVVCHHPFGLGIRLDERHEYGHVDVAQISEGIIRDADDYPPVGERVRARVLGYAGDQLTLRDG
jgi:exosome complex RNA-binding protein Csl4